MLLYKWSLKLDKGNKKLLLIRNDHRSMWMEYEKTMICDNYEWKEMTLLAMKGSLWKKKKNKNRSRNLKWFGFVCINKNSNYIYKKNYLHYCKVNVDWNLCDILQNKPNSAVVNWNIKYAWIL